MHIHTHADTHTNTTKLIPKHRVKKRKFNIYVKIYTWQLATISTDITPHRYNAVHSLSNTEGTSITYNTPHA